MIYTPTIYLIRHGKTPLNDPKEERIRGWSDVPIDEKGRRDIERAAEILNTVSPRVFRIISSDLQRTILTSHILNDKLSVTITPDRGLRPWNLGDLTGQLVQKIIPELNYLAAHPDIKAPNGESFNQFLNRWEDGLHRMMTWSTNFPDQPLVGVVHSRNMLSLDHILCGRKGKIEPKGGPAPGQIVKLTQLEEDGCWSKEIL